MLPRMPMTRRTFLAQTALLTAAHALGAGAGEAIIDIHQHTNYSGRSNAALLEHQRKLGITHTVLLPAGKFYGLDAQCGGNDSVHDMRRSHPGEFSVFANEMPYEKDAEGVIRKYLRDGAIGIGEQKFRVFADSGYIERVAAIAKEFNVPVLLHFWDADYNMELPRFHRILEKFPTVNFIGHAQTWWGHIDKRYDAKTMYPKGPVTPGGITDRLLADYANAYADLSAFSGHNALVRDEAFTRDFMQRHQDKLLFGTDCADSVGEGDKCTGAQILAAVRRLAPSKAVERKVLHDNAKLLMKL